MNGPLRHAVALPDAVAVGEPKAGALAAAVAGVGRRGPERLVVVVALGKGVGDDGCEAAEEGHSGSDIHPRQRQQTSRFPGLQ